MTATPGAVAHSRMISSALGHLGDLTAYGAGLRISEVCPLQVDRLDPKRRLIHVRGKGGRDRFVALPAQVLLTLRAYWKETRPKGPLLFPGRTPDACISHAAVRANLKQAAVQAGIRKRVTPHVLRHNVESAIMPRRLQFRADASVDLVPGGVNGSA